MVMEAQEIVMGSDLAHIIKGKRTKRQRTVSPLRLAATSTSSSGGESGGDRERMTPSTSIDFADSSPGGEEDQDMANCLILLAQGSHQTSASLFSPAAKASSAGSYSYRCKTCNRCFPSFQALGGHRASHKKSNNAKVGNEGKREIIAEYDDVNNTASTALSLQISNRSFYGGSNINSTNVKSNKIHECSICGAEFSSGQALGGHMRRHRAVFSSSTSTIPTLSVTPAMSVVASSSPDKSQESKKPRNSLQLDLNLPAPEDDVRESQFHFPSKEQVLVFSASSLVDCHY